jgi:hypothetical protein
MMGVASLVTVLVKSIALAVLFLVVGMFGCIAPSQHLPFGKK